MLLWQMCLADDNKTFLGFCVKARD